MAITYQSKDIKMPLFKKRLVSNWIKQVIESHDMQRGDVSYIFCSDSKILEINQEYLKHDYYTDIITFDYTEDKRVSGDIFISLDTVKSNSEQYATRYEDELHRVIIHGILHLCGINDQTDKEQEDMTKWENKALILLEQMSL